jgi:hypothetical protein
VASPGLFDLRVLLPLLLRFLVKQLSKSYVSSWRFLVES